MAETILYTDVNPSQWVFTPPMTRSSGHGSHMYINSGPDTKLNCKFQLPKSKAPFGIRSDGEPGNESTYKSTLYVDVTDPKLVATLGKTQINSYHI